MLDCLFVINSISVPFYILPYHYSGQKPENFIFENILPGGFWCRFHQWNTSVGDLEVERKAQVNFHLAENQSLLLEKQHLLLGPSSDSVFYYQAPVLELRDRRSFGSYFLHSSNFWVAISILELFSPTSYLQQLLHYYIPCIQLLSFWNILNKQFFPNWSWTNPIWVFHSQIIFLFSAVYIKIFLNSLPFFWTVNVCILPLVLNSLPGIEF